MHRINATLSLLCMLTIHNYVVVYALHVTCFDIMHCHLLCYPPYMFLTLGTIKHDIFEHKLYEMIARVFSIGFIDSGRDIKGM